MSTTITCDSSTTPSSCTIVVVTQPYVATPDDYAAVSSVFGVTLCAAAVIWGVKQLYNLLKNRPEA